MKNSIILVLLLIYASGYSQNKSKDSTFISTFDKNKIKNAYIFDTNSDTTDYNKFIWSDKRNLAEILNELPGYYVTGFGEIGSRDLIKHTFGDEYSIGFFKDGIQINDPIFGGYDIENISVNEIDKIEEVPNTISFLYGLNISGKSVNIITKDFFKPKTFSQLRYSQDRNNSLNADINFTVPLSEKFNFSIGLNNNNCDGRYNNSDFSTWRGRIRLNYFPSPKLNLRYNFNYAQIQRGLNEGLINSTTDTLSDPILARIINPDSYEKISNFLSDISLNANFLNNDNSLTKIKFYVLNSFRQYRAEQNRPNPTLTYQANDYRTIQYGIDLKQNLFFLLSKKTSFSLLFGYNGYFNIFNILQKIPGVIDNERHSSVNFHSVLSKIEIQSERFNINLADRYNNIIDGNNNFGGDLKYSLIKSDNFQTGLRAGYSNTSISDAIPYFGSAAYDYNYYEAGAFLKFKDLNLNFLFFDIKRKSSFESRGFNISADYDSKYFTGYLHIDKFNDINFPDYSIKSDISFHDYFFKNKLNLRVGLNIKYFNNVEISDYSQFLYRSLSITNNIRNNFNLEFYIGARIGTANINFTVGNILNSFNYDAFLYPTIDRGGVFQALSRFTIVWDFLN